MGEHMFMMKSKEVVDWPSVVNDDLVQSVDQKFCERWHFTISELLSEFPQISHTILYEIITVRLGCLEMLMGAHKMQGVALALLGQYHKDDDEFLNK
jgi:hypothetical protein